jgi:hypothetical protein
MQMLRFMATLLPGFKQDGQVPAWIESQAWPPNQAPSHLKGMKGNDFFGLLSR